MDEPDRPERRSVRLYGHDYALEGHYFVTVCAADRRPLLRVPGVRAIVRRAWNGLPERFAGLVETDEYVVMQNHVHGIIVLLPTDVAATAEDAQGNVVHLRSGNGDGAGAMNRAPTRSGAMNGAPTRSDVPPRQNTRAPTLGEVVRTFKAVVTHDAREAGFGEFAWQRGYYEHIIDDEKALEAIRQYIRENPDRWRYDAENPAGTPDIRKRMFLRRIRSRQR